MITGHVWRPMPERKDRNQACAFMNCRRLPAEHERAVSR